jgi:hypothetical protein
MLVAPSYKGSYDALTVRERDCGQFSQARQSEALQEFCSCRKAKTAVGAGEFLHKLEIAKFHNEPALVSVEKPVDFRLADWLLISLKYAASALLSIRVVKSETTPLRMRS